MKTFAILGDSYSTYKGYVPSDYNYWYAPEGNECENDMPSVEHTWWRLFAKESGLRLVANCSFSGSAVCQSSYPDLDPITSSFVYRMKRELGDERDARIAAGAMSASDLPDLILVFGGTNDFWGNQPVGKLMYEGQTETDLKSFGPAFCYVLSYLREHNPKATIVNLINDEITSELRPMMLEACKHYQVPCLELCDVVKENGHPNKRGMEQIEEQLMHFLKKEVF